MRYSLILLFASALLWSACGEKKPTEINLREAKKSALADRIANLEKKFFNQTTPVKADGDSLLSAYLEFVNQFRQDSASCTYMFEAAKVADGLGKHNKAIELFLNYHDGYPAAPKKDEALYLMAFISDAHLHNADMAIKYYNKVVELYPASPSAEQAKQALNWVGMSDEELIKKLEAQNS
jgi:TolA-binding protein